MTSFSNANGIHVAISPATVRPRQTVIATLTTDDPVDEVGSATVEWGYTNFYPYRSADADSSSTTDGGDTSSEGNSKGKAWVCVTRADVSAAAGESSCASASLRIPSWAPASSEEVAAWSCRLTIDRGGHLATAHGDFTVVIGAADVEAVEEPMERVLGDGRTAVEIVLSSALYCSGEAISGQIVLTAGAEALDGELAVFWQRHRESHPLGRHPARDESLDGPIVDLGRPFPRRGDGRVTLPFTLSLPDDATPTTAAVHSSLSWFVVARMTYPDSKSSEDSGSSPVEVVRRPIVVVNTR